MDEPIVTNGGKDYLGELRIQAALSSDRKKQPKEWVCLSVSELKRFTLDGRNRVYAFSRHTGYVHVVTITSVKTWKRRPDVEVHWKYGLYEYGVTLVNPANPNEFFVKEAK
jgi:hypothetical protein